MHRRVPSEEIQWSKLFLVSTLCTSFNGSVEEAESVSQKTITMQMY